MNTYTDPGAITVTSHVVPRVPVNPGNQDPGRQETGPGTDAAGKDTAVEHECREALELWLRWDEQHRQLTEMLFDGKHDAHRVEEALDCCDVLRQRAVELSKRILKAAARG